MVWYKSVNYFSPAENADFIALAKAITESEIALDYAGVGNFPEKWQGSESDLAELLVTQNEGAGIVKLEDSKKEIDIEFSFARDCALIHITTPDKKTSKRLCQHFNNYVASFANVVSEIDNRGLHNSDIFYLSDDCPEFIKESLWH